MKTDLGLKRSLLLARRVSVGAWTVASLVSAPPIGLPGSAGAAPAPAEAGPKLAVVSPAEASFTTKLAARELRRYLYLRTGKLADMSPSLPAKGEIVVLASKSDPQLPAIFGGTLPAEVGKLSAEHYLLRTLSGSERKTVCIVGGDEAGLLYGAYRFCELMGVRFYLHGDVVPDEPLAGGLPSVQETGQPLFNIRGILAFHDFPEGPDWWNRDDYLAYISQLAKLRMNFLGLHCYPENHPHAEPLIWIGLPKDQDEKGRVSYNYPSFWASTRRGGHWGYQPMFTGDFTGGAAQLFASDEYGNDIQSGLMPSPTTMEEGNELFNRAGALLHDAFTLARQLGVKTALGTETPLAVPRLVEEHLKQLGKNAREPEAVEELYEGIFRRIQKTHPLDYYWLWTPEWWTWEGTNPGQFAATVRDIEAASQALKTLGDPFTLATSGWVLGPSHDRTALDRVLPKHCPMACINREVGHDVVEAGFASLEGRPKWSIPWLENDPHLTSVQLWAGRMRYDAADSLKLGCTGLIGIHWRTKILAPNIAALASAAWDQSYVPTNWDVRVSSRGKGPLKGRPFFSYHPVEGTPNSILYQSMREDVDGYDFDMPNGNYTVTLKFNEPQFAEAGRRVFGIKIQGRAVTDQLDIFQRVGSYHALDLSFPTNRVTDGHMRIEFVRVAGEPCVSAIIIAGSTEAGQLMTRKARCGIDQSIAGYERDGFDDKPGTVERRRTMPIEDFYTDFARANFGPSVAARAGRLFARIDGLNLPQTSHWNKGPGFVNPIKPSPVEFQFVEELAALRSKVQGAGNLARFDYWLTTFRYMQNMSAAGGLRADLDSVLARLLKEADPAKQKSLAQEAVRIRVRLARAWEEMMSSLVAATDTPGELGTIANLEQHSRKALGFVNLYDQKIEEMLGQALPPEAEPGKTYHGPARLIVPTVRSQAAQGESLRLRVMAVDREPVRSVELHWRPLGQGQFTTVQASQLGRAVYQAALPPVTADLEYYVSAVTAQGGTLVWPATSPKLCQTVIVLP